MINLCKTNAERYNYKRLDRQNLFMNLFEKIPLIMYSIIRTMGKFTLLVVPRIT